MSKVTEYLKEKEIEIERESDIKNLKQMAVDVIHFSVDQTQRPSYSPLGHVVSEDFLPQD